nr:MAG TPA: hypothetical protein [Caudoviricetes sp.]
MTDYLIDVLYYSGVIVKCFAVVAFFMALFLALNESSKSRPNKADLAFFAFVAFFSLTALVVIPGRKIISCFIAG